MDTLGRAGETWDGRSLIPAATHLMAASQGGGVLTGLAALAHPHSGLHTQRSMHQEEVEEPSSTSRADALAGENVRLRAQLGDMLNNPINAQLCEILRPTNTTRIPRHLLRHNSGQ